MRVVLGEDSVLVRAGIRLVLAEHGIEVVGEAGDAEDLLRKVAAHRPDVAVVDVRMPPTHTDEGLRAAATLRERHPGLGVLVLSQVLEADAARELLVGEPSGGGLGYLLKDRVGDLEAFVAAVRRVGEGGTALDPEVVGHLLRRRGGSVLDGLTPREREVLGLMAEGRSNRAIAERLVVSDRAIEKHVTAIFHKLELPASAADHRRVLAVRSWLQA